MIRHATNDLQRPARESFGQRIAAVATDPNLRQNTLSDGIAHCTYADLPALFTRLSERLDRESIRRSDFVALQSNRSLTAALTLLALLWRGQNVLIVKHSSGDRDALDQLATHSFCKGALLTNAPAPEHASTSATDLVETVEWSDNPTYNRALEPAHSQAPLLLIETSGTSGPAKLCMHEHSRLCGNVEACIARLALTGRDRVLLPVPIDHLYGLGAALLPSVLSGASVRLLAAPNIIRFLDCERTFAPTVAFITPTLGKMLQARSTAVTGYRCAVSAGDMLGREAFLALDNRFRCLLNLYGSSELGAVATSRIEDPLKARVGGVGEPLPGVQFKLLPAAGRGLSGGPDDGYAELWCKSEWAFVGYAPATPASPHGGTSQRAHARWFNTHDLAKQDATGRIELLGRSNLSVNRNGFLVTFADIEKHMEALGDIHQAVVVPTPETRLSGLELVAFCALSDAGRHVSAESLRRRCLGELPRHKVPDRFVLVNDLPTTPSGKLDRMALEEMARSL